MENANKNTLTAFKNIINNPLITINPAKVSNNRINNIGDALEGLIKDTYSDLLNSHLSPEEKDIEYSKVFSWLGNPNNIPDCILRGGDAIEVKKIENVTSELQLNSSYPKNILYSDDSRLASGAVDAEDWSQKDIVYTVGSVGQDNELHRLWFIYGDCYAASRNVYQKIFDVICNGIKNISDIEFQKTNELARVNKVDPLGITNLRIRGMWLIMNPSGLYSNLVSNSKNRQYYLLMREEKYQSFNKIDRDNLEMINLNGYSNSVIDIKNPDNPAQLIKARFIKYEI